LFPTWKHNTAKSNVAKLEGRWKFARGHTQHKGHIVRIITNKETLKNFQKPKANVVEHFSALLQDKG